MRGEDQGWGSRIELQMILRKYIHKPENTQKTLTQPKEDTNQEIFFEF